MYLVGDIGGTKTLLANMDSTKSSLESLKAYKSKEYTDFGAVLFDYISTLNLDLNRLKHISAIGLAVAGPVINNSSLLTNLSWNINAQDLIERTNVKKILLYNDLEAIAAGICEQFISYRDMKAESDLICIKSPTRDLINLEEKVSNLAIIAPGTGLGVAYAVKHKDGFSCKPTEGGHVSFAATTELQNELLQFMQKKLMTRQIGFEFVCSGIGIAHIFEFIADVKKITPHHHVKSVISQVEDRVPTIISYALNNQCEACKITIDLFIEILAIAVQTMALLYNAQAGIYLTGGIALNLQSLLCHDNFVNLVLDNTTMAHILTTMPIYLVKNKNIALIGAGKLLKITQKY